MKDPLCHVKKFEFHHKGNREPRIKCESGVIKLIERPVAVAAEGNWRIV